MEAELNKNHKAALNKLRRSDGVLDLTGESVQRLKDRKAKKALDPILKEMLPRRRKGIESSSYYRVLRVKTLPYNPHFKQDVDDLRELFQIPPKQIAAIDLSQFPHRSKIYKPETVLPAENVAGFWFQIHQHVWAKTKLAASLPSFLPGWFELSAGAPIEMGEDAPLAWLEQKPDIPQLYAGQFDLRLPLDWCVARLIERYRLPWLCSSSLRKFVLTKNEKHLKSIYPFDVVMDMIRTTIGDAYRVTVDWIDEYTTRKQWENIYLDIIKSRQNGFWEDRGDRPSLKHIELDRLLQQGWVFDLYSGLSTGVAMDAMLNKLSKEEKLPPDGADRTSLYRLVSRLKSIMKPVD